MSMGVTRAISSHVTLLGYKELTRPALTKLFGGRGGDPSRRICVIDGKIR